MPRRAFRKWVARGLIVTAVLAAIAACAVLALNLYFRVQTEKTQTIAESIESEFNERCKAGIGRDQGEALLSELDFTTFYVPKERFREGNFLEVFPATPPESAGGYVLGRTKMLGAFGLFQLYLEAIMFVGDDSQVIACHIKGRLDAF